MLLSAQITHDGMYIQCDAAPTLPTAAAATLKGNLDRNFSLPAIPSRSAVIEVELDDLSCRMGDAFATSAIERSANDVSSNKRVLSLI